LLQSTSLYFFFFFIDPSTTSISTLSLHDALPIFEPDIARYQHLLAVIHRSGLPVDITYFQNAADFKNRLIRTPDFIFLSRSLYTDRKSTRLNSSHSQISYAVFCLKKKITKSDR